ncbi:hypothetical protein P6166_11150 [Stenotrophomonas sp. HITSZ_GD]|uniref:hypothetical protein n=1 Tax=Stenotrophomonas sp. HITSZ_GD TaxID=3037248 RepID=UPI00240E364C|nr:hypothetical protein [Stenotrophomonas sp. HITSZ_GD]MDG2525910.1 hypothetical protein [Stenotrophomonas sp. HITSZ_GD]
MRLFAPLILSTLLAPLALPSRAAEAAAAPAPAASIAPAAAEAGLRRAEALGERLLRLDRAAWVASDALMAAQRGRGDARVRGWITVERADGIDVVFVDATPAALYRVPIDADGHPAGPVDDAPPPLSAAEVAQAQARAIALAAAPPSCSGLYNPVLIPGDADDDWVVYVIPGTQDNAVLPLGGAWRYEVRAGQIVMRRPFTNSCIALDNRGDGDSKAFIVSHLLDDIPTEIHVFWSLWSGKSLFVTTQSGVWSIEQGKISAVKDDDKPATLPAKP